MTKEEIKEQYSMQDILARYGLHANRAGFIRCPFHKGDNNPSMKIYEDSFYCFACGANGDIFSFIMRMDGCSFREAYISLDGTYTHRTVRDDISRYHVLMAQKTRKHKLEKLLFKKQDADNWLYIYRKIYMNAEVYSDEWCECYNKYQYMCYVSDYLAEQAEQIARKQ